MDFEMAVLGLGYFGNEIFDAFKSRVEVRITSIVRPMNRFYRSFLIVLCEDK